MKPLREAQREVLAAMPLLGTEVVSPWEAVGRVVAQTATSNVDVPPFANSAMDGFAVVADDVQRTPVALKVNEDVPAGSVPTMAVATGTATRIMTGAPMPEGADAVVRVEDTRSESTTVTVLTGVEQGVNVRSAGGDVKVGDAVVEAGVRITPRHAAALASAGISPLVHEMPTVAIMSTGDEVVDPVTEQLEPGQIRDTNRVILRGVLEELGVPIVDMGIIGDSAADLAAAYEKAASQADVIVSTGGVSMGDYDFVKQVLGERGSVEFWKVAMQPAKPFAFGSINGTPLFGLPGNPVSTFVAFEQFVRPSLLKMMGATALLRPRIPAVMGEDVSSSGDREVFHRVLIATDADGSMAALSSGAQGSNVLSALAGAQAFAIIPVGTTSISAGDGVTLEMFTWDETRTLDG